MMAGIRATVATSCQIDWTEHRLLVQVLDDSDNAGLVVVA